MLGLNIALSVALSAAFKIAFKFAAGLGPALHHEGEPGAEMRRRIVALATKARPAPSPNASGDPQ